MDNKAKLLRRLIALGGVLLLMCAIAAAGLFSLQIINGKAYRRTAERRLTSSYVVSASRGEILDRYGTPLVTNETVYSLRIDYAYWDKLGQNAVILALHRLVSGAGGALVDSSLPISQTEPAAYEGEPDTGDRTALEKFLSSNKLGENLSADEALAALEKHYEIDQTLPAADRRLIAGVRYEMQQSQFSLFNPFVIASDVSMDLIAQVKERHDEFPGVEVVTEAVRRYETTSAAHILGRVGRIFAEEWDEYQEKGYSMNAIVGKQGVEKSFEDYLRGRDGTRAIETDISGSVTAQDNSNAPQPGNNVVLTIDLALQQAAEASLANTLSSISGAGGGAAVALDPNTGEVLAMASYPTIDLTTWSENYADWALDTENTPLLNRAISGAYQPGSTFKPLTAIAGLEEGVIDENTVIVCNRYYTRFQARAYRCMGSHGRSNVLRAIQKSCNVFFYEVGYLLGGEKLEEWARAFGFGQRTGIELEGERAGSASGPANRARMLENVPTLNAWQPGDVITTAIGQSDHAITPLQLANYCAVIANGGTLYKPTLLKTVKTYDYSATVRGESPEIIREIEISDKTLEIVREGMAEVTGDDGTAARTFRNYPIKVAGKSGTAQHGNDERNDHAVFIAYAPLENPQIAVAVVGEYAVHGSDVAPIARDIFDAYFADSEVTDMVDGENVLLR